VSEELGVAPGGGADGSGSAASGPRAEPHEELILDKLEERLDTLRVLRADNEEERGRLLEEIGATGKVEQDIVGQLSKVRPLWRPDRFEEANRLAVRSLEVLDRNGPRRAVMPRAAGPLKPVASFFVQQATGFIVRSHLNTVLDRLWKLYTAREANSDWGSDEHHMLRRARIDIERVRERTKRKALGVPAFLLGGAFISGIFGFLQAAVRAALENTLGVVLFSLVLIGVLAGAAWVVLYAAAIARRRIRLTLDQPLGALYQTIGACGEPPRDQSFQFAVFAIIFTVLAWIVIPLGIWLAIQAD
jgi:hypothetical protein